MVRIGPVINGRDQFVRRVLGGDERGPLATGLRAVLRMLEPVYAGVMRARNAAYDRGIRRTRRLSRPVISVGNLTTGGTGKTPVVRWIVERLVERGHKPAVILRGYRATRHGESDERALLQQWLDKVAVPVRANPDRVAGAVSVLRNRSDVDVFVLDDAFQHRKVARDFDLVLINACEPFGFGHVLPRGLLREPVRGLSRADAVVITHADRVSEQELGEIERRIHDASPSLQTYRATHAHVSLQDESRQIPLDELRSRKFFAFSGIASPAALWQQLEWHGQTFVGGRWFADHHDYAERDLDELRRAAQRAGAEVLVTTEKDWVKIARLSQTRDDLPIWRVKMQINFLYDDGQRLIEQILSRLEARQALSS